MPVLPGVAQPDTSRCLGGAPDVRTPPCYRDDKAQKTAQSTQQIMPQHDGRPAALPRHIPAHAPLNALSSAPCPDISPPPDAPAQKPNPSPAASAIRPGEGGVCGRPAQISAAYASLPVTCTRSASGRGAAAARLCTGAGFGAPLRARWAPGGSESRLRYVAVAAALGTWGRGQWNQ